MDKSKEPSHHGSNIYNKKGCNDTGDSAYNCYVVKAKPPIRPRTKFGNCAPCNQAVPPINLTIFTASTPEKDSKITATAFTGVASAQDGDIGNVIDQEASVCSENCESKKPSVPEQMGWEITAKHNLDIALDELSALQMMEKLHIKQAQQCRLEIEEKSKEISVLRNDLKKQISLANCVDIFANIEDVDKRVIIAQLGFDLLENVPMEKLSTYKIKLMETIAKLRSDAEQGAYGADVKRGEAVIDCAINVTGGESSGNSTMDEIKAPLEKLTPDNQGVNASEDLGHDQNHNELSETESESDAEK